MAISVGKLLIKSQYYFKRAPLSSRLTCRLLIFIIFSIIVIQCFRSLYSISEDGPSSEVSDVVFLKQSIKGLQKQVRDLRSLLHDNNIPVARKDDIPSIYVITPTYARPNQFAELNRLRNTFLNVEKLWWVLVEDKSERSAHVANFLENSGISYTHLHQPTPPAWKPKDESVPRWVYPRGVLQRNAGISWLRQNCSPDNKAVVYFADDDNSYSIELFEEIRTTDKVSVFPVGLVGGVMVERPLCSCHGAARRVTGWVAGWRPDRQFPTDMAGFAINIQIILNNPSLNFLAHSKRGFLETDFLSQVIVREDLEPKADCCKKVLVWHMNAQPPKLNEEKRLQQQGSRRTDEDILV